jgi:sugar-specific transcriptional regulator TrmB
MPDYKNIIKELIDVDSNIISVAIIEGQNNIVYSTTNWDIQEDLKDINSNWDSKDAKSITVNGVKYRVLQSTYERLVASSSNKVENIMGFKNDERKILCRLKIDEQNKLMQLINVLMQMARILDGINSRKPYMDPSLSLGKVVQVGDVSTKFLFDTTKILQDLGLQKFGLSQDEVKVYLALMKKGEKGETVGNLNKELDIKRTTIYRIIERLINNNWVEKLSETSKGTQIYVARPINELVKNIIKEKEKEIQILKTFQLLISEYLKNGTDFSQAYGDSQSFSRKVFDIDVLGIMGLEKDFGIIIFEYENVIIDEIRIQDKLDLIHGKIGQELEKLSKANKIPDYEDKKIVYTKFQDNFGAIIYLKFKEESETAKNLGDDWVIAIKLVAIPVENNIYVIWGSEEKFQMIMDMILNLK